MVSVYLVVNLPGKRWDEVLVYDQDGDAVFPTDFERLNIQAIKCEEVKCMFPVMAGNEEITPFLVYEWIGNIDSMEHTSLIKIMLHSPIPAMRQIASYAISTLWKDRIDKGLEVRQMMR